MRAHPPRKPEAAGAAVFEGAWVDLDEVVVAALVVVVATLVVVIAALLVVEAEVTVDVIVLVTTTVDPACVTVHDDAPAPPPPCRHCESHSLLNWQDHPLEIGGFYQHDDHGGRVIGAQLAMGSKWVR
jgi:hypothetical protein